MQHLLARPGLGLHANRSPAHLPELLAPLREWRSGPVPVGSGLRALSLVLRQAGFAPSAVPHLMPRPPVRLFRGPARALAARPHLPANGIDGTLLLLQRHRWNMGVFLLEGARLFLVLWL
jgi:hypothetical protein